MTEHHSESEHTVPKDMTDLQTPDTKAVPVDTAKIQEALEKHVDQETSVLPRLTMPESRSGKPARSAGAPLTPLQSAQQKKRRTGLSLSERWWTPSVRSWFFTFMYMNMPVIGWFCLFHKARHETDPARKEFARAYLFYKLVFLIVGAVVLLILIWIGLGLLDQLLDYMEML